MSYQRKKKKILCENKTKKNLLFKGFFIYSPKQKFNI